MYLTIKLFLLLWFPFFFLSFVYCPMKNSIVHKYFKVDDNDAHTFYCSLFKWKTTIQDVSSTSTRKRHLNTVHPEETAEPKEPTKQSTLPEAKAISPQKQEDAEKALLDFITEDQQALSVVESPSFRRLLAVLCSGFKVPCRNTITKRYAHTW